MQDELYITSFQHAPLDLKTCSIRLICVLPKQEDGKVRCQIRHASFDSDFTCVSYVWGSADETREILVNDKPFHVMRNIFDTLVPKDNTERSHKRYNKSSSLTVSRTQVPLVRPFAVPLSYLLPVLPSRSMSQLSGSVVPIRASV